MKGNVHSPSSLFSGVHPILDNYKNEGFHIKMSREPKNHRAKSRDELEHQIAHPRAHLETEGAWPEKADELLRQLVDQAPPQELTEMDLEMLSLVVNDALHGVDIQKRYPAFYQRLTEEPGLRDAFLEIFEMAEAGT
jgi:hypothetical protein